MYFYSNTYTLVTKKNFKYIEFGYFLDKVVRNK